MCGDRPDESGAAMCGEGTSAKQLCRKTAHDATDIVTCRVSHAVAVRSVN